MSTISSASRRPTAARALPAIAGIYISQTIVTALATQALPSLLRSEGASLTVLTILVGLIFTALGCVWVALYSALMNLTAPLQAGVDFTVFQSADALLAMAGGAAGGWLAECLGYHFCFGLAAALSVIAAKVVWRRARLERLENGAAASAQGDVHVE